MRIVLSLLHQSQCLPSILANETVVQIRRVYYQPHERAEFLLQILPSVLCETSKSICHALMPPSIGHMFCFPVVSYRCPFAPAALPAFFATTDTPDFQQLPLFPSPLTGLVLRSHFRVLACWISLVSCAPVCGLPTLPTTPERNSVLTICPTVLSPAGLLKPSAYLKLQLLGAQRIQGRFPPLLFAPRSLSRLRIKAVVTARPARLDTEPVVPVTRVEFI